ncbi:MAG: DUF4160 domain-containing protein [Rhodospirillales bacterium]
MPTINRFGKCKICMYFADHGEPHFHVLGPDGQLVVRIADLRVIEGSRRRVDAPARWPGRRGIATN